MVVVVDGMEYWGRTLHDKAIAVLVERLEDIEEPLSIQMNKATDSFYELLFQTRVTVASN